MKNLFSNRLIAVMLSVVFSVTLSSSAFANDDDKNAASVEFKYIGKLNAQPVFQLNLNGANAQGYSVTIEDEDNNILHSEAVKNGVHTLKFALIEDLENVTVRFKIYNKKTNEIFVYQVNQSTQTQEKINVTKL